MDRTFKYSLILLCCCECSVKGGPMPRIRSFIITQSEFTSKWKAHLLFGGGFLAAIAFSLVVNMVAGEHFSEAAWSAVREIKPTEVVMFFAFWYYCAFYQTKDERSNSFTSLNLGSKDEEHI